MKYAKDVVNKEINLEYFILYEREIEGKRWHFFLFFFLSVIENARSHQSMYLDNQR